MGTLRLHTVALVVLASLSYAGLTPASAGPISLERQIFRSFDQADYARAAELIELHLKESPNDAVMLYNAACAYSLLGDRDRAASFLLRAVKAGMNDLGQIVRDPDLAAIRDHPTYLAVVEALDRTANRRANTTLDQWRNTYGKGLYRYERDTQRRIAYATALDPRSQQEMRQMLERQADHLLETLFERSPESFLLVAVPTPQDAKDLFAGDHIGGIYDHDKRLLIARDIGGSLRHEFVHALHYAHMDQMGQRHPLWIQEGLAALYEDYILHKDGSIKFSPNQRHNIVKQRARDGKLMKWKDLFIISEDRFMARATQLYPQVRSIFEFLADRGKIGCWYRALVEHFQDDSSGAKAFEECFDMAVTDVERAWRLWLTARPTVDTTIARGDAVLGIWSTPNSSNDGVLIEHLRPRSAARRAQLRVGDVIVSADGRATRSLKELQAVIASKRVGDTLAIRARRDGSYFTVVVSLRPL
ncbi:MAG: PDZ domain-containing protein [Planctomycetota bacterium]|nr:PDZ domain-containing protein [Planctomycetota bacterium]